MTQIYWKDKTLIYAKRDEKNILKTIIIINDMEEVAPDDIFEVLILMMNRKWKWDIYNYKTAPPEINELIKEAERQDNFKRRQHITALPQDVSQALDQFIADFI